MDNIKHFLSINYPNYELLDTEYKNCKTKMKFICHNHLEKGIQYNTIDNIMNNHHVCRYCSYEALGKEKQMDEEHIINRCKDLNINYIGRYSKNNQSWIEFTCNKHLDKGVQVISWEHLRNCSKGCSYCAGKNKTTQDFIKEMNEINPNIEIIGKYSGSEKPVKCKCKICGHVWSPIGRSLKYGQGCPGCVMSNGEIKVKQFLDKNNISYISQKTFDDCIYKDKLKFDFYLPELNKIIEVDGEQHFKPVDFAGKGEEWANEQFELNKIKDNIKNDYCEKNNINILRIPYWDFKNIETILALELPSVIFM